MQKTQEMMQEILSQIDSVDPAMYSVPFKKEEGEKTLGTLDDDYCRRIFIVVMMHQRESKKAEVDIDLGINDESVTREWRRSDLIANMLMAMIWVLVREKYGLWTESGIGLRKDWEIVRPVEQRSPGDFMRMIMGGR